MGYASLILIIYKFRVRPSFVPVCAQGNKTSSRNFSMNRFPFLYILNRKAIISVAFNLFRNIYDYKRQQHLFNINFIKLSQPADKMPGGINMGAPLTYQSHFFNPETILFDSKQILLLHVGQSGKVRNVRPESVGQVHKFLFLDNVINLSKIHMKPPQYYFLLQDKDTQKIRNYH